ncbi:hypothetical protein F66182_9706 [Fusarium sp. NRRL 66182]|nr:hypothetical protein F66182_9706 [Fusarium sp. NRRL 66182]
MNKQLPTVRDPCCWKSYPELPEPDELMTVDPAPLPPRLEEGKVPTKEDYLELQYRLNRFEGTELLRRAINAFRSNPSMAEDNEFNIYTQVHVEGYLFAKSGPACRISFSPDRSPIKVNWKQSTRLTAGTLVALSTVSDCFAKQCFLAVVAARYLLGGLLPDPEDNEDENTPPRIEIFWSNCADAVFDPTVEMVMLEAKGGYFETVRHAMVGLQHAASFESKFDKYIVGESTKECTAAYLNQVPGRVAQLPDSVSLFDPSQQEAFDRMTSRELAVIQGPPGTGKTFTSVVALESYVRTLKAGRGKDEAIPPVVVAAQTNHALDQLLNRCSAFEAVIVRLGGRTEDKGIASRTLYNIRQNSKLSRGASKGERSRKAVLERLQSLLTSCFPPSLISAEEFRQEELISKEQRESLDDEEWESAALVVQDGEDPSVRSMAQWLEGHIESDYTYVYRPPTDQADAPDVDNADLDATKPEEDNEKERLPGQFFSTKFYVTGSIPNAASAEGVAYQARKLLAKYPDLYTIRPQHRGIVYRHLRRELIRRRAQRFAPLLKEYLAACDEVKISRWEKDVKVILDERIEILGCTTTGLTKYRGLIAALKPRVLMIEEAAETREANISSALYPSLDQIVLVGDHQQLAPQVDVQELARYNMHVSLFEKLVKLNLPYTMLQVQRRMIPAVREVVNAFYPKLTDHYTVNDPNLRPPVPGMGGMNLFWFRHEWDELQNTNDFSFSNPKEADMIVRFVRYLVQNGIKPGEITMLTFYRGQVAALTEKLRGDPVLLNANPTREWSVRTVDGFQGEENEVILLSLVRSVRPGFVQNENRAVVATSRAKCGMYIFGNDMNLLKEGSPSFRTWSKVHNVFAGNDCIGNALPVTCKNHGRVTDIWDVEGWDAIPGAGCGQSCDELPDTSPREALQSNRGGKAGRKRGSQRGNRGGRSGRGGLDQQAHTSRVRTPPQGVDPNMQSTSRQTAAGEQNTASVAATHSSSSQTIQPSHQQEPTSEELMENGYYSQILEPQGTMTATSSRYGIETDIIGSSAQFETGTLPATGDSTSDKWSPEKVSQHDAAEIEVSRREQQKSPCPTVVSETFRPTSMAADGSRVYGPVSYRNYTIPAPGPEQISRAASSPASSSSSSGDAPSRKHQALDAAAGAFTGEDYSDSGQGLESAGSVEADIDESTDLISFD